MWGVSARRGGANWSLLGATSRSGTDHAGEHKSEHGLEDALSLRMISNLCNTREEVTQVVHGKLLVPTA